MRVEDDTFISCLETTIENLRALVLDSEQHTDAMTESLGNDFSGQSLPDILPLTPDVEGAEQWIREASHYLIAKLAQRDEGVSNSRNG